MTREEYAFAYNLNGTGTPGIVTLTNPPRLICLCSKENSRLILDALNSSLPPAEGAKTCWNCGKELRYSPNGVTAYHCACGAVNPGERQQPTAEGAEEIGVYDIANKWAVWVKGNEVTARDSMVADIYGLLNVHAQKIADKMVSERLREV